MIKMINVKGHDLKWHDTFLFWLLKLPRLLTSAIHRSTKRKAVVIVSDTWIRALGRSQDY
ncbi:MAG: hypothetical protein AB7P24_20130 [Nitrospira sp.]